MSSAPRPISPRWRQGASALLAWTGFTQFFYSAFLPVPDVLAGTLPLEFAGLRFGWAMSALGLAGLLAAAGVWRRAATWGRWLGVAVTVVSLAYQLWMVLSTWAMATAPAQAITGALASLLIPGTVAAFVLFALLRQWEPRPRR